MSDRTATNATIRRATFQAQADMNQLDADSLDALQQIYEKAAADIRARIASYAGSDGNIALNQLQDLLQSVNAQLRALSIARDNLLTNNMSAAAALGTTPYQDSLGSASTTQINHNALSFVRSFVAADGLQLSDRLWRIDRHARDVVTNAIEMAVIQGHGALQSARELLARGQQVPGDIVAKMNAANATALGKTTTDHLTGSGGPMDNAMRLMRTELNRAHGEAYINATLSHPDAVGIRFKLSPNHPKHDICDLHATANLYGLGKGVYPDRQSCPWPAHPNTLSYVEPVFSDEVTPADKAGKETPMQALERLPPEQRKGVLGAHKNQVYKDENLTQGMIKSTWAAVRRRVGNVVIVPPKARAAIAKTVGTLDGALSAIRSRFSSAVAFDGATGNQLRDIYTGMMAVLKNYQIRIGNMGWIPGSPSSENAYYQFYPTSHQPGINDSLRFNKQYAAGAIERARNTHTQFMLRRKTNIARTKAAMEDPGLSEAKQKQLQIAIVRIKSTKRWSASSIAKNPLSVTASHESGHVLYFQNRFVATTWKRELDRERVTILDRLTVSEYGSTSDEELFAEVTAFIADGKRDEMPDNILRAYDAAIGKVK